MSNTIVFAIVAFQTLVHFLVTGQTIREGVTLWVTTKAAGKTIYPGTSQLCG